MRKAVSLTILGTLLLAGSVFAAHKPPRNVSAARHKNLAAAQHHIDAAFKSLTAAQAANEFDLGGHAAKAKELLEQADREIKAAAVTANHN